MSKRELRGLRNKVIKMQQHLRGLPQRKIKNNVRKYSY